MIEKLKAHVLKFRWVYLGISTVFLIWFFFFSLPRPLFSVPYSTILFSDDGQLMGATIAEDGQWRYPENDSVPQKFGICIRQFEDAWFDYHPGFNPVSLFRAFRQNISSGEVKSGGSTLTMQVIRLAKRNPKRTYAEKFIEIIQAVRLEMGYSKKSILNKYAAHAPFGGNVVGLDAASWRYFGKLPHQLSWSESATLAVLPNAPALIFPGKNQEKLENKRNLLLKKLRNEEFISEEDYQLALLEDLPQKPNPLPESAYHLLHTSSETHKGERIHSTLDAELQQQLRTVLFRHHQNLKATEIHNAAILVIETQTGEVKAYLGNTDDEENSHSNRVDIVQAARSSGSILKPFLYENMLAQGRLLPEMLLNDTPSDITENYDQTYDGAVPADDALARSLNIPAIDMLKRFGVERFYHQLQKLDFTTVNRSPEHYGLSLIVGGAEVNLWELSRAYRNLAWQLNHPEKEEFIQDISYRSEEIQNFSPKRSPFQPQASFLTAKALQQVIRPDAESGWRMFGKSTVAWKTGTSHGFKDAWAVGITPEFVVGVWVGNADGEGRPGIIGVKAAAPLMFDVFSHLKTGKNFPEPSNDWIVVETCSVSGYKAGKNCPVKKIKVSALAENLEACPFHQLIHLDKTGHYRVTSTCHPVSDMQQKTWFVLPAVQEWYFERKNLGYKKLPPFHPDCEVQNALPFAFIYPRNFTKILLPVDLQGNRQKVIFQLAHRSPADKVFWYLDSKFIGTSQHTHQMPLQPAAGEHILVLSDEKGNRLVKKFTIVE